MDGSLLQKWKKSAMKKCILPGVHLNPGVYRRQINFFRKGMLNLAFETYIVVSLVYTFFRIFAQCVEGQHGSRMRHLEIEAYIVVVWDLMLVSKLKFGLQSIIKVFAAFWKGQFCL